MSETFEVTLTEAQRALLRTVLYGELKESAEVLAEQADDATQGLTNQENPAGDDAHSTLRHRLEVVAELLDKFGWSVRTDGRTIVEFERERRVTS